jgi:hypothetical protein
VIYHQNGGGMNQARHGYEEKGEKERLAKYIMFIHPQERDIILGCCYELLKELVIMLTLELTTI